MFDIVTDISLVLLSQYVTDIETLSGKQELVVVHDEGQEKVDQGTAVFTDSGIQAKFPAYAPGRSFVASSCKI
jgi:hypothetical protein